jgi:iron complex transport system substrate-binding protein
MHMKKSFLLVVAIFLLLSACSSGVQVSEPLEVTDSTGHTAVLDGLPERIAIAGKATIMVQDAIYLFPEAIEKVVALENRNQSAFSFLPVLDPGLNEKEIFEKNVGPEQIAAAKPDLVLMKSFMAEQLGEPLGQLDLPVLYLDLETPEAFYQDLATLGVVFGNQERATELVDYYQDRVSAVEDIASVVSPDQKPSVLVIEYSDEGGEVAFSVPPVSWLQTKMVEIAGGDPVWKDLEAGGGWTVVNLEQIAAWDPDIVFLVDYSGNAIEIKDAIAANPILSNFRAVKNGQLYAFGYDFYSWDQPDTRWILGLQWLVTKIHPELSTEINILEEVNSFYSTLYGMDQETIEAEVLPRLTGDVE